MYECESCPRQFDSERLAARHMDARYHWAERFPCDTCEELFVDPHDSYQHMDDCGHWDLQHPCESCDLKFRTPQQARVHMDVNNHWGYHWCSVCAKGVQNENNLWMHNLSAAHRANFPHQCEACNSVFPTFAAARKHMDQNNHWRTHWCAPCQRGFQNANNLKEHLHGAAHNKDRVVCPFCRRRFTTAGGIVQHVESASCPCAPQLDRHSIYEAIRARDTSGVITNKLLTWDDSANAEYAATAASWNGHAYECYLCHQTSSSLRGLNQHLTSPTHKQELYHCFGPGCRKQFSALAPLFAHLESESCGVMRFGDVPRTAGDILTGRNALGF